MLKRILNIFIFKLKTKIELEELQMVEGYTILIMNGLATIDRVPARHKEAVLENLSTLGLDGYGNSIEQVAK